MSNDLRSKIIRLAHQQPSLRSHLLPLLVEDGRTAAPKKKTKQSPSDAGAIAKKLVKELEQEFQGDTGDPFVLPKAQQTRLENGVKKMIAAGAVFDDHVYDLFVAGDGVELENELGKFDGFEDVNKVLDSLI